MWLEVPNAAAGVSSQCLPVSILLTVNPHHRPPRRGLIPAAELPRRARRRCAISDEHARVTKTYSRLTDAAVEKIGLTQLQKLVTKRVLCVTLVQMRIALYARVSTKDKGQDHENQLRDLRDFVSRKASDGWVLAQEHLDKASGKSAERPAFRRMFDAASRKDFDLV